MIEKPNLITTLKNKVEVDGQVLYYETLRPGGNDTALVKGIVEDSETRKKINDAIMSANPNVEQVGFYDISNLEEPKLMMAGGEFCGNATRSLAYLICLLSGGQIREVSVSIRLNEKNIIVLAGASGLRDAWAIVPIKSKPDTETLSAAKEQIVVELEGITHVITNVTPNISLMTEDELKKEAFEILQQNNLVNSIDASGVMFIEQTGEEITMYPVVWVRDVATLFYETSCGSGSAAVAIALARKDGDFKGCNIVQPTGSLILAEILDNEFEKGVRISGPIKRLK